MGKDRRTSERPTKKASRDILNKDGKKLKMNMWTTLQS